jgi:hypothetical protein
VLRLPASAKKDLSPADGGQPGWRSRKAPSGPSWIQICGRWRRKHHRSLPGLSLLLEDNSDRSDRDDRGNALAISRSREARAVPTGIELGRKALLVGARRHPIALRRNRARLGGRIFDGEGTAGVGSRRKAYPQPSMEIPQSSASGIPDSLTRFQAVVGVGSITGPHPPRNPWARLPSYRWGVSGHRKVEAVAGILWQWLGSPKRSQIEWALSIVHAGLIRGAHRSPADRGA